jgi:hypothetical protein
VSADPRTEEDWQAAVDCAAGALALDAARQYGLVTGGPAVDVARCEELLDRGRRRGIDPRHDAVERFTAALLAEASVR